MSERCETDKTPQAKANATDKFNSIARHNQRHCLFDNAATTNQAIFSAIFNSLLGDESYDFDIDDVKELSGDLYADIGLNLLALAEGMDVIPSYSPIVGRALEVETASLGGRCDELFNSGLLVPEFDDFSWNDILELRQDRHIAAFRNAVYDVLSGMAPVDELLQAKIQRDLWQLASDVEPNVRQSLLGAIGSNLPSPIVVNPIGIGLALKEVFESRLRAKKFGHVFFVQKMRTLKTNKAQ